MGSESICMRCMAGYVVNGRCTHCGKEPNEKSTPLSLPIGWKLRNGRYYIGDVLGCGGYGITYAAWDYGQRKRVAIKEYYPKHAAVRNASTHMLTPTEGKAEEYGHSRTRFLQEAKILHSLQNASDILKVYDLFDEMGTSYYTMEYLEGCTLQQNVKDSGTLSWNKLALPTVSILDALEQMHGQGLFHRDISPDNIILLPDNSARLIDFGSARNYRNADHFTVSVKKQFSPCELWQSNSPQGPWTDVFSLGATLYFCLTGVLPKTSIQRLSAVRQNGTDILTDISKYSPSVPEYVRNAVTKAMNLNASDRYRSAEEFKAALFRKDKQCGGMKLVCLSGLMAGRSFQFRPGSTLSFGRGADNSVRYPDTARFISRHHCSIRSERSGEIYLRDEASSNGTFLNGNRLRSNQWIRLKPGDRFGVANEIYTVRPDGISHG